MKLSINSSGQFDVETRKERVRTRRNIQQALVYNTESPWTNRDNFSSLSDGKLLKEAEKYCAELPSHNEEEDLSGWENRAYKRMGKEDGPAQAWNDSEDQSENTETVSGWENRAGKLLED